MDWIKNLLNNLTLLKWVKKFRRDLREDKISRNPYKAGLIAGASEGVFINFFNLTEEDLL